MDNNLETGMMIGADGVSHSRRRPSTRRARVAQRTEVCNVRAIQQRFLPRNDSIFDKVQCSSLCRQAEEVGGDFYDLLHLPNRDLGIAIGDVSGKGVGAALMMASLQATLRAEVRHHRGDLAALIETANRVFYEVSLEQFYSTLFYAALNPATLMMKYVNAGHFPPMIVRTDDSRIEWLDRGGPPVGIFANSRYEVGSIALHPCDLVIAYTDGIVESSNSSDEQFGVERLARLVQKAQHRTPVKLIGTIMEAIDAFTFEARQRDDMALLVLRVMGLESPRASIDQ